MTFAEFSLIICAFNWAPLCVQIFWIYWALLGLKIVLDWCVYVKLAILLWCVCYKALIYPRVCPNFIKIRCVCVCVCVCALGSGNSRLWLLLNFLKFTCGYEEVPMAFWEVHHSVIFHICVCMKFGKHLVCVHLNCAWLVCIWQVRAQFVMR